MEKNKPNLPEDIIQRLNELGYGGRTLYIPHRETSIIDIKHAIITQVSEKMMAEFKAKGFVDINIYVKKYKGKVSYRHLYNLRKRTEADYVSWRRQERKTLKLLEKEEKVEESDEISFKELSGSDFDE